MLDRMRLLSTPFLLLSLVSFVRADLPVVDLGYVQQRATIVNVSLPGLRRAPRFERTDEYAMALSAVTQALG
jgi:hypothetical protein